MKIQSVNNSQPVFPCWLEYINCMEKPHWAYLQFDPSVMFDGNKKDWLRWSDFPANIHPNDVINVVCGLIKNTELDHFRTNQDTGSNPRAIIVMNSIRAQVGLPYIFESDLPSYDEKKGGYYMPENSKLLCAPEILAKGGKI